MNSKSFLFFLFCFSQVGMAKQLRYQTLQIKPGISVGEIRLGMSLSELQSKYGKRLSYNKHEKKAVLDQRWHLFVQKGKVKYLRYLLQNKPYRLQLPHKKNVLLDRIDDISFAKMLLQIGSCGPMISENADGGALTRCEKNTLVFGRSGSQMNVYEIQVFPKTLQSPSKKTKECSAYLLLGKGVVHSKGKQHPIKKTVKVEGNKNYCIRNFVLTHSTSFRDLQEMFPGECQLHKEKQMEKISCPISGIQLEKKVSPKGSWTRIRLLEKRKQK